MASERQIRSTFGEVTLCRDLVENAGLPPGEMRTLDVFGIVYVYRGSGHYHDETGEQRPVSAGSAILLMPGLSHWYGPDGAPWSEVFFLFRGAVFESWLDNGLLENARVLALKPVDVWLPHLRQLLHLSKQPDEALRLFCELQKIWATLLTPSTSVAASSWSQHARELIRTHCLDDQAVRTVAKELGMGYENFRKRFVAECGVSPGKFLQHERLAMAALRLESTSDPVAAIADDLGYCDPFHFSRRFSERYSCSPTEYRRRQQQLFNSAYPESREPSK